MTIERKKRVLTALQVVAAVTVSAILLGPSAIYEQYMHAAFCFFLCVQAPVWTANWIAPEGSVLLGLLYGGTGERRL